MQSAVASVLRVGASGRRSIRHGAGQVCGESAASVCKCHRGAAKSHRTVGYDIRKSAPPHVASVMRWGPTDIKVAGMAQGKWMACVVQVGCVIHCSGAAM